MNDPAGVLERVCAVRGLRGAVLVSASDGLVVSESRLEGGEGPARAARAARRVSPRTRAGGAAGRGNPVFVQLAAERGSVLAAPAGDDLVIVAVAGPDANIGLARLELAAATRSLS